MEFSSSPTWRLHFEVALRFLENLCTSGLKSQVICTAHSSMKERAFCLHSVRSYDSQNMGVDYLCKKTADRLDFITHKECVYCSVLNL